MEEWTIPAPAPPFLRDWILITVMTGKTESALQPHSIAGTFCLLSFGQAHAWPQPLSRPHCARWYVYCRHSSGAGLQGCQWTGYLNNFDAELSYITPSGAVMTGIASCKKGRPIPGAKRLRFALPWLASRLLRSSVLALVSFPRQRCFHEKWQTTITVSFVCVEQEGGSCFHRYDCTPRGVTHPRHPPPSSSVNCHLRLDRPRGSKVCHEQSPSCSTILPILCAWPFHAPSLARVLLTRWRVRYCYVNCDSGRNLVSRHCDDCVPGKYMPDNAYVCAHPRPRA